MDRHILRFGARAGRGRQRRVVRRRGGGIGQQHAGQIGGALLAGHGIERMQQTVVGAQPDDVRAQAVARAKAGMPGFARRPGRRRNHPHARACGIAESRVALAQAGLGAVAAQPFEVSAVKAAKHVGAIRIPEGGIDGSPLQRDDALRRR
ncbi:hypothetical protein D3C72_1456850 [compost metagenome]